MAFNFCNHIFTVALPANGEGCQSRIFPHKNVLRYFGDIVFKFHLRKFFDENINL